MKGRGTKRDTAVLDQGCGINGEGLSYLGLNFELSRGVNQMCPGLQLQLLMTPTTLVCDRIHLVITQMCLTAAILAFHRHWASPVMLRGIC
jgi:hypothetical protein